MIYPDVTVEEWKKRYGVRDFSEKCRACGTLNTVNRPFITKDHAGLCIESCGGCDARVRLYASVPHSEKEIKEWNEIMGVT